jgi:hypothetical protein
MTQDLFRREAVEFSTQRLYGHIVVRPKLSHVAMLTVALTCVALALLTLTFGVRVQTRHITGEISISQGAGGKRIAAFLYSPKALLHLFATGQRLRLQPVGFSTNEVGAIDASVLDVSAAPRVAHRPQSSESRIYVPIALDVEDSALAAAGLPTGGSYKVDIATDLVLSRESWLEWLFGCILNRAHQAS